MPQRNDRYVRCSMKMLSKLGDICQQVKSINWLDNLNFGISAIKPGIPAQKSN